MSHRPYAKLLIGYRLPASYRLHDEDWRLRDRMGVELALARNSQHMVVGVLVKESAGEPVDVHDGPWDTSAAEYIARNYAAAAGIDVSDMEPQLWLLVEVE